MTPVRHRAPSRGSPALIAAAVAAIVCVSLRAEPPDGENVRRVRGIIDRRETWSGLVIITDDLTIEDGTVTVEPGTVIEFAQASFGSHPTLTVGSASRVGGELELQATADRPIVFRTRAETHPGRLVINVRSRLRPGALPPVPSPQFVPPEPSAHGAATSRPAAEIGRPSSEPNEMEWRYVRFENLGYARPTRTDGRKASLSEAAVAFNVLGGPHKLTIRDCAFINSSQLEVRASDGAQVAIRSNRFESPGHRAAVDVSGNEGTKPAGGILVQDNVLASTLAVASAAATIADNILIGRDACIVVQDDASPQTRIVGNYVHNTTDEDDGHYCLNCENPAAEIANNVIRGGTVCVLNGSRKMSGNVLIGAERLRSKYVKNARTHQLVQALPLGAVFERNLLLGPAYSLLVPQPSPVATATQEPASAGEATPATIRHNLFDGFADTARAIHLNQLSRRPGAVAVVNNVFLRVPIVVFNESVADASLVYAAYNAMAPRPEHPFERTAPRGIEPGRPGFSSADVVRDKTTELYLQTAVPGALPDFDPDILTKKLSTESLRGRLFDAYRPQPRSPLVGAGRLDRPEDGKGPRPSIGPSEPTRTSK